MKTKRERTRWCSVGINCINLNQLDNLISVDEVEVSHFVIFTERIFAPSDVVTVGWDIS